MSNKEINETYNRFRGVKGYEGDINVLSALTHYFLLDASYDHFKHHVQTLPLKHMDKKIAERMAQTYDRFFTKFLAPFDLDQRIYLGEKSDELREHIKNDVERARLAMMDCCCDEDTETQTRIADLWLCNRFASEAQDFHKRTWKKSGFHMRGALYTKPDADKDIDGILKYSIDLAERLYGKGGDVSEKHYERFQACVKALTRKVSEWLSNDYQNEIAKNNERTDDHIPTTA